MSSKVVCNDNAPSLIRPLSGSMVGWHSGDGQPLDIIRPHWKSMPTQNAPLDFVAAALVARIAHTRPG